MLSVCSSIDDSVSAIIGNTDGAGETSITTDESVVGSARSSCGTLKPTEGGGVGSFGGGEAEAVTGDRDGETPRLDTELSMLAIGVLVVETVIVDSVPALDAFAEAGMDGEGVDTGEESTVSEDLRGLDSAPFDAAPLLVDGSVLVEGCGTGGFEMVFKSSSAAALGALSGSLAEGM